MTEGLQLHDDGTVSVGMGDKSWTLRVPIISEWRKLREMSDAATERASGTLSEMTADPVYAEWFAEAIRTLGDADPPPVDEMSMWALVPDFVSELVQHWTFVPLARGARNALLSAPATNPTL